MKRIVAASVFVFILASLCGVSHAAGKRFMGYNFGMWVISDRDGMKSETRYRGRPFVYAQPGEEYSIKLTNPLPYRVAVNLIIDGLNSLTGKPVKNPSDGMKWIIPAHGTIRVRGWQHGSDYGRRFYFTSRDESYARWQGDRLSRDLDVNCGVIAAAFFWADRQEVTEPEPYATRDYGAGQAPAPLMMKEQRRAKRPFEAGTGSGRQFGHDVDVVDFDYDTGMYNPQEMVVIYYDFEQPEHRRPEPRPVPGFKPNHRPFAPDPHRF